MINIKFFKICIFCFLLCISFCLYACEYQKEITDSGASEEVQNDTIQIDSYQKLLEIQNNDFENISKIELVCDIDCQGGYWYGLGNEEKPFDIEFDGNGFSIKNLTLVSQSQNIGFINYAKGAYIHDLTFSFISVQINVSNSNSGIFAILIDSKIENILINDCNFTVIGSGNNVGIMCGYANLISNNIQNIKMFGNSIYTYSEDNVSVNNQGLLLGCLELKNDISLVNVDCSKTNSIITDCFSDMQINCGLIIGCLKTNSFNIVIQNYNVCQNMIMINSFYNTNLKVLIGYASDTKKIIFENGLVYENDVFDVCNGIYITEEF